MTSTKDGRKPSDAKDDTAAQAGRPPAEPATKIKPLDEKIGEAPGHLRSREEAFKRRHGKT